MKDVGSCMYCGREGEERLKGAGEPSYVCTACWAILRDPRTALPFLRGHLTLQLRGTVPEGELEERLNAFMKGISGWKRPG